jgi:hypothetical protein
LNWKRLAIFLLYSYLAPTLFFHLSYHSRSTILAFLCVFLPSLYPACKVTREVVSQIRRQQKRLDFLVSNSAISAIPLTNVVFLSYLHSFTLLSHKACLAAILDLQKFTFPPFLELTGGMCQIVCRHLFCTLWHSASPRGFLKRSMVVQFLAFILFSTDFMSATYSVPSC